MTAVTALRGGFFTAALAVLGERVGEMDWVGEGPDAPHLKARLAGSNLQGGGRGRHPGKRWRRRDAPG